MTLTAIYIGLYLVTVVLCFLQIDPKSKYKKALVSAHLIFLVSLIADFLIFNLRGIWADRLILVAFLLTASTIFALFRKTLGTWQKLYFGLFLFYPAIAAITFLVDRIMFAVIASPLIISLAVPEIRFSNDQYELREDVGIIAPMRLKLVEKGVITEKVLGTSDEENVANLDITSLSIENQTGDTTKVEITSVDKKYQVTFTR